MNLLITLRSELFKTKNTASWYLALFSAAIIPAIILVDFCADGFLPENLKDPWNIMFAEGSKGVGAMIFPVYVILICTLLPQVEFRNNTWKQLFASPQPMINVYVAKFLNVQLLIVFFMIAYNVLMALTAVSIHLIDSSVGVGTPWPDLPAAIAVNGKLYLAMLAMSAFQFWLGLRYRNFISPVAIGFMLWMVACIIMLQAPAFEAALVPYTYPIISVFPVFKSKWEGVQWGAVSYALIFLVLGFVDFRRRLVR